MCKKQVSTNTPDECVAQQHRGVRGLHVHTAMPQPHTLTALVRSVTSPSCDLVLKLASLKVVALCRQMSACSVHIGHDRQIAAIAISLYFKYTTTVKYTPKGKAAATGTCRARAACMNKRHGGEGQQERAWHGPSVTPKDVQMCADVWLTSEACTAHAMTQQPAGTTHIQQQWGTLLPCWEPLLRRLLLSTTPAEPHLAAAAHACCKPLLLLLLSTMPAAPHLDQEAAPEQAVPHLKVEQRVARQVGHHSTLPRTPHATAITRQPIGCQRSCCLGLLVCSLAAGAAAALAAAEGHLAAGRHFDGDVIKGFEDRGQALAECSPGLPLGENPAPATQDMDRD